MPIIEICQCSSPFDLLEVEAWRTRLEHLQNKRICQVSSDLESLNNLESIANISNLHDVDWASINPSRAGDSGYEMRGDRSHMAALILKLIENNPRFLWVTI